ncbi:MAG: four helix bundle protein [Cyclobacteriaceae bacterium]|nr:four helix bundle protein [Cyclobacteriaceae bacterium]
MKKENPILEKSYQFGLRIVKLHVYLSKELKQFEISSQVLRSGTSIGANVEEAVGGSSRKDFINKLNIAYKEVRETKYWLRLLKDSETIKEELAESLIADCDELLKILYTIINTSRQSL